MICLCMCVCGGGGVGGGGGGRADEDLKIRTPHNDVGKNICPKIEKNATKGPFRRFTLPF